MSVVELKVPTVGESITEVFINRWLKNEGDFVQKDETVAELETDKATFELPAPITGVVSKIACKKGETAKVGQTIGSMEESAARPASAAATSVKAAAKSAPAPSFSTATATAVAPPPPSPVKAHVMPSAQRAMAQQGLVPAQVTPSGPGGRLLKEDVLRAAPPQAPGRGEAKPAGEAPPRVAPAPAAREEQVVPMSPMRQTIARRLVEAQKTAALLTTFNEVDMSAIMALRKKFQDQFVEQHETKLGFMSFFIKAAVDALKRFPALNAEIRDNKVIYRNYYDIGIAVSTPKGLVVPVVRDAQSLSFAEIEQVVLDFGKRGKENKIDLKELEGGTFTLSNGGVFGSMLSTPIVNPPQSGVLGMHAILERPVAVDGQVVIRPMMYLALTYDHRIVDGREAVTFLKRIKECVEDPARMLMEV